MELNFSISIEKSEMITILDATKQIEESHNSLFEKINILSDGERELIFKGGYIEEGSYVMVNEYKFRHYNFIHSIQNVIEVWLDGKDIRVEKIDNFLWKAIYYVDQYY